jgi:hypothetical protein
MSTLAHGVGDWHDLALLGVAFVAPVILLAVIIIVGKIRGDDDDDDEDEPVGSTG